MNETRLRVIQEQLKQRYKDVWDFEFFSDSPEYDEASQKEDFLATIAYFVHFILGTEELEDLFESLVSYYSRLEASDEVEEINRSLMEDLREFARMIKSSPKWPKFLSDVTHPGVLMSVLPTEEDLAGIESTEDLIDKASATIYDSGIHRKIVQPQRSIGKLGSARRKNNSRDLARRSAIRYFRISLGIR